MSKDGPFSFTSLIPPGEGSRRALERHITLMQERERRDMQPAWLYSGMGGFLLAHGEFFGGRELPDEWRHLRGPSGHCHGNSLKAAEAHPELRYFTGMYMVGARALAHSWCVTPGGELLELTLPTLAAEAAGGWFPDEYGHPESMWLPPRHWAYVGVEYEAAFVREHHDKRALPIIDPLGVYSPPPSFLPDEDIPAFTYAYHKSGFPITDAPDEIKASWHA